MRSCVKDAFQCPAIRQNFTISGMEKPESSMGDDSRVDLEDRDPHRLNQHLQVIWEEVVGEPDGIRSPECAWRLSGHCFRLSRGCCYVLLSVLVAPIIALCLGLTFACLAFEGYVLQRRDRVPTTVLPLAYAYHCRQEHTSGVFIDACLLFRNVHTLLSFKSANPTPRFIHIWCIGPCLRVWRITCSATRNFCTALVQSVVRPCTDSLGYFFYNIRVLNQRLPDVNDHKEDVHIV
ncbi:hypothetical protein TSAR_014350 [Trichomalopsis sarcophagae]|uniref:Caveolin n=1 Tax=Trichomalopsis sarcophagae TaxID=543379 RepID=A0A232ENZ5_9HYME|nr:hypothetical protein TSAR_014350 [Trichomalopsis sarcophagae]